MNKALTERSLSLLPIEHQLGYQEILTRNPNRRFEVTFNHFYNDFGQEDEVEMEDNKEEMRKTWHPRHRRRTQHDDGSPGKNKTVCT